MRKFFRTAVLAALTASLLCGCADKDERQAKALARRVVPEMAGKMDFVCTHEDECSYTLQTSGGRLTITGNNVNSLATGLGHYLRDCCNVSVDWFARNAAECPDTLPQLDSVITRRALVPHRFFLNYCTFGYTLAWWKWKDWERLIDWMALNGVTMAMANTGQEAVWQKVWMQFGMTEEQTREYFTGPAFLPWHRMTNIDKWEGPLPQKWIDSQARLQKKILARETSLGITPIMGSFNGHIPEAMKELYPDADIRQLTGWSAFPKENLCWYLSPADSLYRKVQKIFLEQQKKMYGTPGHIYGVDPFNEVDPPRWDPEYLAEAAELTYDALAENDPDAVWLQMGWLFWHLRGKWTPERIEAYLSPVPKGRLIMLDYYGEMVEIYRQTENFYGQDFIWSYLGNFGGNTMMSGNFPDIEEKLDRAFVEADGNFKGIGCTLEGLGVDRDVFEYTLDRAWEKQRSSREWAAGIASRHNGRPDSLYTQCWTTLHDKAYRQIAGLRTMFVTTRPTIKGWNKWHQTGPMYDNADLLKAWGELAGADLQNTHACRFDCVNIARQCLENAFGDIYRATLDAYSAGDSTVVKGNRDILLGILDDLDTLLGSEEYFLLGRWLDDARSWGDTPEEKDWYEHNARMLITCWGPKGGTLIDYAGRSLNGLVRDYYRPRWERFLNGLRDSLESGEEFDCAEFDSWCRDYEWNWAFSTGNTYPTGASGDPIALTRELFNKYSPIL